MGHTGNRPPEERGDAEPRRTAPTDADSRLRAPEPPATSQEARDAERVSAYSERLLRDERPVPAEGPREPGGAYAAAAMLRGHAPDAAEPSAEFTERLWQQVAAQSALPHEGAAPQEVRPAPLAHRPTGISRRAVLAGGLATAASLAAGVGAGVALDRSVQSGPNTSSTAPFPVPLVQAGQWVSLFTADSLAQGQVRRFVTDTVVGFVRRTATGYQALSGACTHMGCLLAWNATDRTFDCPCHGGRFLENGTSAPSSSTPYRPLPEIATKVESGMLWVYIPTAKSPTTSGTPSSSSSGYSH